MKKVLLSVALALGLGVAQDELNQNLSTLGKSAVQQYIGPLATGWAAGLNSGWNMRAPQRDSLNFQFELSAIVMRSSMENFQKTFNVESNFRLNQAQAAVLVKNSGVLESISNPQLRDSVLKAAQRQISSRSQRVQISGPTIVGDVDSTVKLRWKGGRIGLDTTLAKIYGQDSVDLKDAEMSLGVQGYLGEIGAWVAAPQLRLGTMHGTNVVLRILPQFEVDRMGFASYYGVGVDHNFSRYFRNMPVELVLSANVQRLRLDEYFKMFSYQGGVWLSKTWGPRWANVQPYLGLSMESSDLQIGFDVPIIDSLGNETKDKQRVNMDFDGDNLFRGTLGLSARLAVLDFNVEYALANRSVLSVQAGLAF